MTVHVGASARAIVTVLWGPLAGRKAIIAPGGSITLGRGELSDLVVPGDLAMAAKHVELRYHEGRVSYRDLDTKTGTQKNGEDGIREGDLRHGDWIRAGETTFTVHFEGATPPPAIELDEIGKEVERERLARAEVALRALEAAAAEAPLHAILDMARDKRILTLCRESVEEHVSLYDGIQGENLASVAPHMVRLSPGSRLLAALVREGWERRWGIWLVSRQAPRELRRHLRRFLMVELEVEDKPKRVYFRFYDPRTIATFLPTCTPRQAQDFFGDAIAIYAEARGGELRRYTSPAGAASAESLA